jgi:hypothetical protein
MKRIFTKRIIHACSCRRPATANQALQSAFERGFIVGLLNLDRDCPYKEWGHARVFHKYWHDGYQAGVDLREDVWFELSVGD